MTLLLISHKSCNAEVLFDDEVASIQVITSKKEGRLHATKCIEKIEIIARNKKLKEIWFTTVSKRMEQLLEHLGYTFTNFGPHPEMPDAGDIIGYKKVLKT